MEDLDEPQDSEDSESEHFTFNPPEAMEDLTSNCLTLVEAKIGLPSVVVETHSADTTPNHYKKKTKKAKNVSTEKRSKSFHSHQGPPHPKLRVIIPRLQIEESPNEDYSVNTADTADNTASQDLPSTPTEKPRKRRKSLVNLLFPKGSEGHSEKKHQNSSLLSVTNTDTNSAVPTSTGQRLHFRRLSDFMCNKNSSAKKPPVMRETSKDDCNYEAPSSSATKDFLSQLFPHRRRRSSVTHLDNTQQFRETKEEYLEATRRRMSSFPPCDGDESALMLEKIHNLSKLEENNATTPVSESKSPLKLLKNCLEGAYFVL